MVHLCKECKWYPAPDEKPYCQNNNLKHLKVFPDKTTVACDDFEEFSDAKPEPEQEQPKVNLCATCKNLRKNKTTQEEFCGEKHKFGKQLYNSKTKCYEYEPITACADYKEKKKKAPEAQEEQIQTTEEYTPQELKQAEEILKTGDPITYILDTFNEIHVGDRTTGKVLLAALSSQVILNSSGIQPKLSGNSGKGKSHAVCTILHLTPPQFYLITSLSDKAIFYINVKEGTFLYSDDVEPSEDLQSIIKRSTTNFQSETKHTTIKSVGGELKGTVKKIAPRIVWCLSSVMDNGSMEFLNRQFNLGVDETTNQDEEVMKRQLKRAMTAEVEFPITDKVRVCRAIIKLVRDKQVKVIIPFADRIEWHDTQNRRNIDQFLDLIKAFAVYYQRDRKITDNVIEATIDDFNTALTLYQVRATNQKHKVNDNELDLLKKMVKGHPYMIEDLQKLTGRSYQTIYRMFKGRDGKAGLLEKVPELEYHPETELIDAFLSYDSKNQKIPLECENKKTKPHEVYILTKDFSALDEQAVASIRKVD